MQLRLQVKLYWRHSAAGQFVEFENTQFSVGEKQDLHCRFGEHYFSKTSPAETPSSSCTMAQSSSTTQLSPDGETPPCSTPTQQHPMPDGETPRAVALISSIPGLIERHPSAIARPSRTDQSLSFKALGKVGCPAGIQNMHTFYIVLTCETDNVHRSQKVTMLM